MRWAYLSWAQSWKTEKVAPLADALFLAAANASRANAPKSEIPVPVVRPVAEEGITQQSCPNNRPRRRKMAVDPVQLVQDAPNARAAKTPHEALAMGIWTEHREWDYLPPYRACVTTVRDQKRSLTGMCQHAQKNAYALSSALDTVTFDT